MLNKTYRIKPLTWEQDEYGENGDLKCETQHAGYYVFRDKKDNTDLYLWAVDDFTSEKQYQSKETMKLQECKEYCLNHHIEFLNKYLIEE